MHSAIFYEILEEAVNSHITFDDEVWPIGFNTRIYNKDGKELYNYKSDREQNTLIIKDEEKFFRLLTEYVNLELQANRSIPYFAHEKDKNSIKMIMAYLFANATTEDFQNPNRLLERNIAFLKDTTFDYLNEGIHINLGDLFFDSDLVIKKTQHSIFMETPSKIDISIEKEIEGRKTSYPLSSVTYGIEQSGLEKVCYIYSLMKNKPKSDLTEEEHKFMKKVARNLYKLNENVSDYESDEYFEYRDGNSKYYPENISDVSPSSVLSTIVFISLLQKDGIHKIKVVPYLPIRYASREFTAKKYDEEKKTELDARNKSIQENITNKFIRTFMRAKHHVPELDLVSYPYEADEFLNLKLRPKELTIENQILEGVSTNIVNLDHNSYK